MGYSATVRKRLDPALTGREAEKLESDLRRRVIGQGEAIEQIINVYQTYLAGMNSPGRPVGNFLFLGPTGTGKTRAVEATAESLLGDERAVVKIDCAEFQHSHEIAKLIGSPPGYLGHRETHPLLSQEVLSQFYTERLKISFVLFDEIEKASDALWNLLLGILDKATLTLGDNRRVDFSKPGFPFWPSWSVYDSRLPAAMQRFSHCCQVRYSFRCRSGLRMLADHGVPAKPEGPLATPLPRRPSVTRVRWLFRAVDVILRAQVAPKSAAACRRTTSGSDVPPQAATNNIARASRAVRPSSSADAASSSATSF